MSNLGNHVSVFNYLVSPHVPLAALTAITLMDTPSYSADRWPTRVGSCQNKHASSAQTPMNDEHTLVTNLKRVRSVSQPDPDPRKHSEPAEVAKPPTIFVFFYGRDGERNCRLHYFIRRRTTKFCGRHLYFSDLRSSWVVHSSL